jgi:citrate lyase beta subunit
MNLSLDNNAHIQLWIALGDIEEAVEKNEKEKALSLIKVLVDEVRYSNIISSFETVDMFSVTGMNKED